jgi:hypothetical protein
MKQSLSQGPTKSSTQKLFRSSAVTPTKRIAYAVIMHPDNLMSQRKACKLIRVPRGTCQRWDRSPTPISFECEKECEFFHSPEGILCLHRIILVAGKTSATAAKALDAFKSFWSYPS